MSNDEGMMTAGELADRLRVGESTVRRWARDGLIPVVRLPRAGLRFEYAKVRCGTLQLDELARDRDQLWAEAAQLEEAGMSIRLDPALYGAAAAEQEGRVVNSVFYEVLEPMLAGRTGKVLTEDLWVALGKAKGDRRNEDMRHLGEAMQRMGWERSKSRFGGPNPQWGYERGVGSARQQRLFIVATKEGDHVVRERPV